MSFAKLVILYMLTLPVMWVLDGTWLMIVARNFYKANIGTLMRPQVVWWAVIAFYLIYLVGILYFAVLPGVNSGSWHKALLLGVLFGFFTYMTYDFTNYATLNGFPLKVLLIDILWGTIFSGVVASVGYFIAGVIK